MQLLSSSTWGFDIIPRVIPNDRDYAGFVFMHQFLVIIMFVHFSSVHRWRRGSQTTLVGVVGKEIERVTPRGDETAVQLLIVSS